MQPENNPYEFITGTPAPQPTSKVPLPKIAGEPNSVRRRVIIVAGGVIVLIIVAVIVQSIIGNIGKANVATFATVAQDQSEIIAISKKATNQATAQAVKNLAITAQLSVESTQSQYLNEMHKVGTPLNTKQAAKDDPTIESDLTNAITTGTYDSTYVQIMQNQLTSYASALQAAFKAAPIHSLKTQLTSDYAQVQLIQSLTTTANDNLS
jgi:hypothetical protein